MNHILVCGVHHLAISKFWYFAAHSGNEFEGILNPIVFANGPDKLFGQFGQFLLQSTVPACSPKKGGDLGRYRTVS